MTPARGEVWLFDLGMAEKVRPALIVSVPYGDIDRALITIVPHTTSLRGSRYEIQVNVPFLKPGAFLAECRHIPERSGYTEARRSESGTFRHNIHGAPP